MVSELNNHIILNQNQFIEVSIGEIADKYSILKLKKKYITDTTKLNESYICYHFNIINISTSIFTL